MNADCKQRKTSANRTGKVLSARIAHPEAHLMGLFNLCWRGGQEDPRNSFKL